MNTRTRKDRFRNRFLNRTYIGLMRQRLLGTTGRKVNKYARGIISLWAHTKKADMPLYNLITDTKTQPYVETSLPGRSDNWTYVWRSH